MILCAKLHEEKLMKIQNGCSAFAVECLICCSSRFHTVFINVYFVYRTIAYSVSKTRFFVGKQPFVPVTRELPITNTFSFTMIIYDAAFPPEVENVFSVSTGF